MKPSAIKFLEYLQMLQPMSNPKKEQGQETESIFLFELNSKHLLAVICR